MKKEKITNYENQQVEVQGLASISKDVKQSVVSISRNEIRFLVDSYYQRQDVRKASANQVRSLKQGYDSDGTNNTENEIPMALEWLTANQKNEEAQLKKMLETYAKNDPVGQWLLSIVGIGPVIAAGLLAYFDIDKCNHFNQFHSYAGLNDNNNPWLGKDKAKAEVTNWLNEHPEEDPKNLTDEIVIYICGKYHRTYETSIKQAYDSKELEKGKKVLTKSSVESWLAKPPYNKELKTLCWKIGESFLKVSNKENSLYGKLFKQRMAYEKANNEAGKYANEAAKKLATCKITDKKTREIYESGKLTEGHILSRVKRYTVKIFIAHLFEAMWWNKYHTDPPCCYAIQFLGHTDYIAPEVDYRDYC